MGQPLIFATLDTEEINLIVDMANNLNRNGDKEETIGPPHKSYTKPYKGRRPNIQISKR